MKKYQIAFTTLLLVLAVGSLASEFAQTPSGTNRVGRASIIGLMRTINTLEVTDRGQYRSYAPWQTLLERHAKQLNDWLRLYSQEGNVHFGATPEILPSVNLRLIVQTDGQGYVVVLEDTKDKDGYAALSDERGIIWLCKPLQ